MPNTVRLGTAEAAPGRKAWGQLHVKEGRKRVSIPAVVVHGAAPGRHAVLVANQHGAEINGFESIRRFVEQVNPRQMRGTVFAIPSANPRAAMLMNECWPEDDDESLIGTTVGCPYVGEGEDRNACPYNMNRKWPGRKGGLLLERVLHEIWNRALCAPHAKADLLMDFHCHHKPSCVYATCADDVPVAAATGVPAVIHLRSWGHGRRTSYVLCRKEGIRSMTLELEGQRAFNEAAVEYGRRAVCNLLRFYEMLDGKQEFDEETVLLDPWRDQKEARPCGRPSIVQAFASADGLVRFLHQPFEPVCKGQIVCEILNPFTGQVAERVPAPLGGTVFAMRPPHAACRKGQALFDVSECKRVNPTEYLAAQDVVALRQRPTVPE